MKTQLILKTALVVLTASAGLIEPAPAQTVVTERPATVVTTTSVGRLGAISPDTLVMESAAGAPAFVRSSRTIFVDETGTPVSVESILPGAPVTVYYTTDEDRLIADRVVVQRAGVVSKGERPVVTTEETTTTTTVRERDDDVDEDDIFDDDDD